MIKLYKNFENKKVVSEKVQELRWVLGLTQEGLARKLNVTWGTVNRWENKVNVPSRLAVEKLNEIRKENGLAPIEIFWTRQLK